MLADVYSCAVMGLQGALVSIEVDIGSGLPNLTVVGLPDTAVQEAKERVRAAIKNSGCLFPNRRVTVNMAPADLRKAGPSYDLPMAVGILLASGQVEPPRERSVFLGELGLDGSLRHTNGVLPMVALAAEQRFETVYVPSDDAREAALLGSVRVMPVRTLGELAAHLRGDNPIRPYVSDGFAPPSAPPPVYVDMSEIKGQEHVKRALEIAASGHHNVFRYGTERIRLQFPVFPGLRGASVILRALGSAHFGQSVKTEIAGSHPVGSAPYHTF